MLGFDPIDVGFNSGTEVVEFGVRVLMGSLALIGAGVIVAKVGKGINTAIRSRLESRRREEQFTQAAFEREVIVQYVLPDPTSKEAEQSTLDLSLLNKVWDATLKAGATMPDSLAAYDWNIQAASNQPMEEPPEV